MSYAHLSIIVRSKLEILHQQGKSARAIARDLGRHHATISRELRRNETQHSYRAERSQESYVQRRKSCIPSRKWSLEQSTLIEEKLRATWSPEPSPSRGTVCCLLQNDLSLAVFGPFGERHTDCAAS
ncbi:helix-turn-helix protein [Paenibacillus pabuli]|uniref:Helix-turn-helix protein n=2 Tax=Paenibacillus pabuli TaxID=1472 RepID=A0ABX9BI70_9BACL|nr:helix-turn-helix protein [Paenibacillus pabuli]